jgi:hypothetical protein
MALAIAIGALPAVSGKTQPLPKHTVHVSPLPDGKRVEVDVHSIITKEQCKELISMYMPLGGPDGQVSVHIPGHFTNQLAPWCVYNFDGQGVTFNYELKDRGEWAR